MAEDKPVHVLRDVKLVGALACGHDPALSQIAKDRKTAWCYVCEEHVEVISPAPRRPGTPW